MYRENLERNFGFILNDVARLLRTSYDRRIKSLGLTRSQWWVVTHLFRRQGATQSELAEILEVEKATLGRHLDRLEAKGWVRREPDPVDRRVKRLFLGEATRGPMNTMRELAAEVRREALAGLTPAEQELFVDLLLKIKGNLNGGLAGERGNGKRPAAEGRR